MKLLGVRTHGVFFANLNIQLPITVQVCLYDISKRVHHKDLIHCSRHMSEMDGLKRKNNKCVFLQAYNQDNPGGNFSVTTVKANLNVWKIFIYHRKPETH